MRTVIGRAQLLLSLARTQTDRQQGGERARDVRLSLPLQPPPTPGPLAGSEQEEYVLERYMQEEALHQNAWTGSWTQPSTAGGSLTHKAPGDPARLFGGHHRPRETH